MVYCVALNCGSRSTSKTFLYQGPVAYSHARFTASVDFPTPPFMFTNEIAFGTAQPYVGVETIGNSQFFDLVKLGPGTHSPRRSGCPLHARRPRAAYQIDDVYLGP